MTHQSQTIGTILWPPRNHATFVWNIFAENVSLKNYRGAPLKMENLVYIGCLLRKFKSFKLYLGLSYEKNVLCDFQKYFIVLVRTPNLNKISLSVFLDFENFFFSLTLCILRKNHLRHMFIGHFFVKYVKRHSLKFLYLFRKHLVYYVFRNTQYIANVIFKKLVYEKLWKK